MLDELIVYTWSGCDNNLTIGAKFFSDYSLDRTGMRPRHGDAVLLQAAFAVVSLLRMVIVALGHKRWYLKKKH